MNILPYDIYYILNILIIRIDFKFDQVSVFSRNHRFAELNIVHRRKKKKTALHLNIYSNVVSMILKC